MCLSRGSCQAHSLSGSPGRARNKRWQHRAMMSLGGGGGCGPCVATGVAGSRVGMVTDSRLHWLWKRSSVCGDHGCRHDEGSKDSAGVL